MAALKYSYFGEVASVCFIYINIKLLSHIL